MSNEYKFKGLTTVLIILISLVLISSTFIGLFIYYYLRVKKSTGETTDKIIPVEETNDKPQE